MIFDLMLSPNGDLNWLALIAAVAVTCFVVWLISDDNNPLL